MVALLLLALCAPLAKGITFDSEALHAIRQADKNNDKNADGSSSILSQEAMGFFLNLENASSSWPVLMPPADIRRALQESRDASKTASLVDMISDQAQTESVEFAPGFQPSENFQRDGAELPWGIGSPRTGDNFPVHEFSPMSILDVPKWVEYSLETGDNLQTFSNNWQDVKLITQVLENVTNGFYLDTHGGDGETNSYTLLLELTGWRGLIIEPMVYNFAALWGKMRKAWLFLGCVSPTGNSTKIGFDAEGNLDMNSGHMIHAHSLPTFMSELGGRKTIDFWAVHNGRYEADVIRETFFESGKNIEFGVVLARFDGRVGDRGDQPFAQARGKDQTEALMFEIMHNASFNYIGGLDAYWINYIEPRYSFMDHVWVNPAYFQRRGISVPSSIKSAPPPGLKYPRAPGMPLQPGLAPYSGQPTDMKAGAPPFGYGTPGTPYGTGETWGGGGGGKWDANLNWDAGYSYAQEVDKMIAYIAKAKQDASATESVAKAHRVAVTRLSSVEGR